MKAKETQNLQIEKTVFLLIFIVGFFTTLMSIIQSNSSSVCYLKHEKPFQYIYAMNIILVGILGCLIWVVSEKPRKSYVVSFLCAWALFILIYSLRLSCLLRWLSIKKETFDLLLYTLSTLNDGFLLLTALLLADTKESTRERFMKCFLSIITFTFLSTFYTRYVIKYVLFFLSFVIILFFGRKLQLKLRSTLPRLNWAILVALILYGFIHLLFLFVGGSWQGIIYLLALAFKLVLAFAFMATIIELRAIKKIGDLSEKSDTLEEMFDKFDGVHYKVDQDNITRYSSPAESRILGKPISEIINSPRKTLYFSEEEHDIFVDSLKKNRRLVNEIVELKNSKGERVYVQTNTMLKFNEEQQQIGREGFYFEVTNEQEQLFSMDVTEELIYILTRELAYADHPDETLRVVSKALREISKIELLGGICLIRSATNDVQQDAQYFVWNIFGEMPIESDYEVGLPTISFDIKDSFSFFQEKCQELLSNENCIGLSFPVELPGSIPAGWIWLRCKKESKLTSRSYKHLQRAFSRIVTRLRTTSLELLKREASIFGLINNQTTPVQYLNNVSKSLGGILPCSKVEIFIKEDLLGSWTRADTHELYLQEQGYSCLEIPLGVYKQHKDGFIKIYGRLNNESSHPIKRFPFYDMEVLEFGNIIIGHTLDYLIAQDDRLRWIDRTAHEIAAPISGIRGFAHTLQHKDTISPELRERMYQNIDLCCKVILGQISDLRSIRRFGKEQSRRPKSELTELYGDILMKVATEHEYLAKASKVTLACSFDDYSIIPELYLIKTEISQVFSNLLQNAVKYRKKESKICKVIFEFSKDHSYFIIAVKDWGIGINRGLEDKIFEEGYRSEEALEVDVIGNGLGLTIAKEIVQGHGGMINCVHNVNPTVFEVKLPKTLANKPWT